MTGRWLITGARGMVATDLCSALERRGTDFVALAKSDLDVTDARAVHAAIASARPSIVVNCAGYTRVDDAESDAALANAINGTSVELLADAANASQTLLMHVSSDFVFDGRATSPYAIDAVPAPLSAYGRSKLMGEQAAARAREHVIVRTSWLFGRNGPNFVEAIRKQIRKGANPLCVVKDQRGRPTWTPHLGEALIRIAEAGGRGIIHYADQPECTWFDFARAIVEELGAAVEVQAVTTEQFPRPARRPAYSVLSTESYERLTGAAPGRWRDGLRAYLLEVRGSRCE